jgi:dihydrofolate reductase
MRLVRRSLIDTILMGRKTYDWIVRHEQGNFPYQNKECYVFTRSAIIANENVTFIDEDLESFTNHLNIKTKQPSPYQLKKGFNGE